MWDQLEAAQQQGAQADAAKAKKEPSKPETSEEGTGVAEVAEQGAAMRSQINLFWGNVLFEHSQVEVNNRLQLWRHNIHFIAQVISLLCRLCNQNCLSEQLSHTLVSLREQYRVGLPSWKELLDAALEKFVSAGAATDEIDGALKNHPANLAKEKAAGTTSAAEPVDAAVDTGKTIDSNGNIGTSDDDDAAAAKSEREVTVDGEVEEAPQAVAPKLENPVEGAGNGQSVGAGSNAGGKQGSSSSVKKMDKGHEEKVVEDKSQTKGASDKKKPQGR